MPIYEYQCAACGHQLEKLQKISAPPLTDCPECGAPRLRKRVSAAAFRLKGGGWYETDFKPEKSRKNLAQADEKPAAGKDDKPKDGKGKDDKGKGGKSAPKDSGKTAAATKNGGGKAGAKKTGGAD